MSYIKYHLGLLILIHILFTVSSKAATPTDTINYSFKNKYLQDVIPTLINEFDMSILYVNQQIDSVLVNAYCKSCSQDNALDNLLEGTLLAWKKVNEQYIIYDKNSEQILPKKELSKREYFSIEGYVIDSNTNEPLPYAAITIKGTGKGVITDPNGFFSIKNLKADVYKLNILYIGYQTDSLLADLSRNKNIKVKEIKLNPKFIELDAVIIRKSKIHLSATINNASVVVFNPLRLRTTPTMDQGDIVQNIRLSPGVNIIPDDPMGINLRGGSSDQTLILFDRIPIYHTQHLMGFNGLLNANCAESISLHSGGFTAQYGDRLSGVLDVKGNKGKNKGINGGVSANLYTLRGYLDLSLVQKFSLYVTFNKSTDWFGFSENLLTRNDYSYFNFYDQVNYTGKYGTGFNGQGLSVADYEVSMTDFIDITTKLTYNISKKDTISFTLLHSTDQVDVTSSEAISGERSEKWKTQGVNLDYRRAWTKKLETGIGAMISLFDNNTRFRYSENDTVITDFNNKNNVTHLEAYWNLNYKFNQWVQLHLGMDYSDVETDLYRSDHTDSIAVKAFQNQVNESKLTSFAEIKISPFNNVDLNLGLRSNRLHNLNLTDFEPRLGIKTRFAKYFSASLAWGIYHQYIHRTPSVVAYNLSSIGPTGSWLYSQENLHPSGATHWLAGLNFDTKLFSIHASAYYKTYSDLHLIIPSQMKIAYIDNSDRDKRSLYIDWINNREVLMSGQDEIDIFSGSGQSRGLEFIVSKNKGIYTGFFSYHLSQTKFTFPYMNNGESFVPSYDRSHEFKTMNYLSYFNWNLGGIIYWSSGKPYPNKYPYRSYFDANQLSIEHPINWEMKSDNRLPAYINVDLSLSYDFKPFKKTKGTVGVVVQNVFDTQNIVSKYYTWTTNSDNEPQLELKNQYAHGRLFNVFLSFDF